MSSSASDGTLRCLLVRAGEAFCALPLDRVRRIERALELHPISGSSPTLAGLVEFNGEPLPVLDLTALLGATPGGRSGYPLTIVVWAGTAAEREAVGLLADAALRLVELPVPAPAGQRGLVRGEVEWQGQIVRVLDLEALAGAA